MGDHLPITKKILNTVVKEPYDHWPKWASIPYFIVAGPVVAGGGALLGFALDEIKNAGELASNLLQGGESPEPHRGDFDLKPDTGQGEPDASAGGEIEPSIGSASQDDFFTPDTFPDSGCMSYSEQGGGLDTEHESSNVFTESTRLDGDGTSYGADTCGIDTDHQSSDVFADDTLPDSGAVSDAASAENTDNASQSSEDFFTPNTSPDLGGTSDAGRSATGTGDSETAGERESEGNQGPTAEEYQTQGCFTESTSPDGGGASKEPPGGSSEQEARGEYSDDYSSPSYSSSDSGTTQDDGSTNPESVDSGELGEGGV